MAALHHAPRTAARAFKEALPLASPMIVMVTGALSLGVVLAAHEALAENPTVALGKSQRSEDLADDKVASVEAQRGAHFHEHAIRRWYRAHYFNGPQGTLDVSIPLMPAPERVLYRWWQGSTHQS